MPSALDVNEGDEVLMRRVADGNRRALGTLYDRHGERAYGLALSVVGREADAEEVVADAFLQVWASADDFDPERGKVSTWLSMIVRSRAIDRIRATKRRREAIERSAEADPEGLSAPLATPEPSPEQQARRKEIRERLDAMLSEIPEEQRRAITLAYFDGLTQSEIAETREIPLGTVKSRIRAGMKKLRTYATEARRGEP